MTPSVRNHDLSNLIGRLSKTKVISKKGLYKRKPTTASSKKDHGPLTKKKTLGGANNGGEREIHVGAGRHSKWYPAEDVKHPKKSRKSIKPSKLKSSLTPGTIVILLAGKFKGKKAVFLKQLKSGLLLVTGPFKLNGVPLKRVPQSYVIATSTKVELGDFKADEKLEDSYFVKPASTTRKGTEGEFFKDGEKEKQPLPADKVDIQKSTDVKVVEAVKALPHLDAYLKTPFSLSRGDFPHLMKF